jgi:hypothetical protein
LSNCTDKRQITNKVPGGGYASQMDRPITLYALWYDDYLKDDMSENNIDYEDKSHLSVSLKDNGGRERYDDFALPMLKDKPSPRSVMLLLVLHYDGVRNLSSRDGKTNGQFH